MLTVTHLAVVIFAAMLLRLNRHEWFIAILFGVLIDADHLFALPRYVADNGWAAILRQTWDDGSGLPWKSLFHYPVGAFVVGYLSLGWRMALPLTFWSVHLGMDWLQLAAGAYSTAVETAILVSSVAGVVCLSYSKWATLTGGSGLRAYAGEVSSASRAWLSGLIVVMSGSVRRT